MPQVKEYFQYLRAQPCADLLGENRENVLRKAEEQYGNCDARSVSYRIFLNRADKDALVCVNPPEKPIGDYQEGRPSGEFTPVMSKEEALSFLHARICEETLPILERCLTEWEPYSEGKQFLLDFEISGDKKPKSVRICFPLATKKPERIDRFLNALEEAGLCPPSKAAGLAKWVRVFPQAEPFLQNDISHFSFRFHGTEPPESAVVLRQSSSCRHLWFNSYFGPHQMNLELTTRCPLRCPQCYVSLNTGKELPLDKALYWLRNGAASGVKNVNLSGGETLCYPYLNELIRECKKLSMRPAVALSGAYVTEGILRDMIEAGVDGIYISLNGSTEEVNSKTRDGYALAICALSLLRELEFPETYVNWVMHSYNAENFSDMLALCEKYRVKGLIILAFKPDSAHELKSFPSADQIQAVARTVKRYEGPVLVDAEACFSQMRAVLKDGFLMNVNRGVGRGCGAGRDGVSVNVDGKLTPCRHLEIAEDFQSIETYWRESEFLKRLRGVERNRATPCRGCQYEAFCLPCMAVGIKLHGDLNYGMSECPLADLK